MSDVEQPKFTTLLAEGPIEIRKYAPQVAAEVTVTGERSAAIRNGFRIIAAYIFGANKPHTKIAMTAPVLQLGNGAHWTVRFIMPAEWTTETLPEPSDARVRLVPVQERRMLAIRFSGRATDALISTKIAELREFALKHKLDLRGDPVLAFYNPPWTLPFLRRNEVMFELSAF
ncbi:heme-binding protein [Hyphomicrobium sp. ghe19]|uniref:SOUL family heme-binding protein n=1 Tax=Hyphomicrobium sp. ghe19 TaxID=2682968 RepID=UPI0030CE70A2